MSKLLIILLSLLAFYKPSYSQEWTKEQKQLAAVAATLYTIDWAQTRYISKNPDKFTELNPFLGSHPSISQVNRHFIISGLLIGSAAHFFPQYRSNLLKIYIGVQTINTIRNFHLGIRLEF